MAEIPIVNLVITPTYGTKAALIRWEVTDIKYLSGKFNIQRSTDGLTNWKTLYTAVGITSYLDSTFCPEGISDIMHYRVILQYDGKRYDTNPIAPFDILRPREFRLLRRMLSTELDPRNLNLINLLLYKPLRDGILSSNIDLDTKQSIGNSENDTSYGQLFVGGFDAPIVIKASIIKNEDQNIQSDQGGFGAVDKPTITIRTMAYPDLLRDDLIVNPRSDDRYIVNTVQVSKFKGLVPFVNIATLLKLDRSDIRYKLPINHKICQR